jgi:hypothetical protein
MRGACWTCASALALGVLAGAAPRAAAQAPAAVAVSARVDGDALVVSVVADRPLPVQHRIEGAELLATFDGPVRVELDAAFVETSAGWIGGVQSGYDTLLVRAVRDVEYAVSSRADGLDLRVIPRGAADPEGEARARLRLSLLRAHWHAAGGDGDAELETLRALERQAPADVQVLTALGAAERRIGWRRMAEATFARALAADRADPEVRRQLAEIAVERAPRARLDVEHRDANGEWTTTSQRSEGARVLSDAVQVGGRLELLRFDAARVRLPTGDIGAMRRVLQRGEAWVEVDTLGGSTWSACVAAAGSGLGLAAGVTRPQPSGRWTLQAEVNRPFWEFAEALAGDGTRDRAALERRQRLGRRADSWVTVSANRYAIADGSHARTAAVSGGVVMAVRDAAPYVAVSYGFDKESLAGATQRVDGAGAPFAPVPIVSREIHVPGVAVRQDIGRSVSFEAHAGYAVDRLGGRGPVFEGRVRVARSRFSADVGLDRRLQTLATTVTVTRMSASIGLRF